MATSNEKVKFESLVNATVKANNSNDSARSYDISADVTVRGNNLESANNGQVAALEENRVLASFSKYMGSGLNINFMADLAESEQCPVLTAVNAFIADTKAKIESTPVTAATL